MPRIWMSPSSPLQSANFKYVINDPSSCSTEKLKVENLRRQVKAIATEGQELLFELGKANAYNKAALFLGVVAKTCYSFLDLTAALAGDALPKPLGKKVKLVATAGMAAIDMSAKTTQAVIGTGTWGGVMEQGARSATSVGGAAVSGPVAKIGITKVKQGFAIKDMISSSSDAQTKAKGTFNLATSNIELILSLAKDEGVAAAGNIKTGFSTIKAAHKYNSDLEKLLDEYFENKSFTLNQEFAIKLRIKLSLAQLNKALAVSLKELEACGAAN